ncbi:MAG TPA: GNAT family N-acetyltransferase [Candidatus Limnocylindria bacterium]|nr:GNAT family N-acetyltransferase [Candidatus Limnocylindria bacterium]
MEKRSIRVLLEPGFDHGRTGAWLADWPGAFCWGNSRAAALDRVPSAASRFVHWLARHGETADGPPLGADPEVVEEVAAFRLDDGYEVNATFTADEQAVSADEMEAGIRRLGYARRDLLRLLDRLTKFESGGGRLEIEQRSAAALASGASAGRQRDEVLRHVAGAEAWFASRLDGSVRYEGPPRDGELGSYLEATRAFLLDTLRATWRSDPAASRVDGKGERWTLAKLLRRAPYHSLDHLEELDRRLALAENRAGRLEIRRRTGPAAAEELDVAQVQRLFGTTGFSRRAAASAELTRRTIQGATEVVSAWDGQRLVGFGRVISDEATNAYISTVVVAPDWQDRRVGRRIMEALLDGRDALKVTLDARDGAVSFYERLGFGRDESVMVRPRIRD